jgi:hypothetical protein
LAISNSVRLRKLSYDYLRYLSLHCYWTARSVLRSPGLVINVLLYNHVPFLPATSNVNKTLDIILNSEKSFVRIGDGDLALYFFQWKWWWSSEVKQGYDDLLLKPRHNLVLGVPDITNQKLQHRPGVNVRHWKRLNLYFCSLMSGIQHSYGSSFAFRPSQYYDNEIKADLLAYLVKLSSNYGSIVIICDAKSSLTKLYHVLSQRLSSISLTLITVPSQWNAASVHETMERLNSVRNSNISQLVFSSYGHVSRWSSGRIIDMGYRIIDLGQLDLAN